VDQLKILPMAFVMIAGPQILSAIFLATSKNWLRNTAAYLAGAALSITLIVSIACSAAASPAREAPATLLTS
jgi:small neutral amino acid transporter SnatA (MarC family)